MSLLPFEENVAAVRAFTRFYTRKAGILNEVLLNSRFGLTEARILHELAVRSRITARDLTRELDLDPAYVSRVMKKFDKDGFIFREVSNKDRRKHYIALTEQGRNEYNILDQRSARLFGDLVAPLSPEKQAELLSAMNRIQSLLTKPETAPATYLLRPHRPGDMGWIVQAHGRLYSQEYGWDETFEALVAEIAATFLRNFDAHSECCWIAEMDGQTIGSAVVVRQDEDTAKLRLVIVDPVARGLGVGVRLVEECLFFARQSGYRRMTLWTNDNLHAAIAIYQKLGFELIEEEDHHSFGKDLVGQYWSLDLK